MYKFFLKVILFFISTSNLYGHSLMLNLLDNEDNTITIVGEFDTGAPAIGALVKIKSLVSGDIIYKKRLPEESELTIEIPKEEYKVILDGGPGHTVEKKGIPPKEGFSKKANKKTQSSIEKSSSFNIPTLYLSIISFILLFLTIVISIINTNKLMKKLEHS